MSPWRRIGAATHLVDLDSEQVNSLRYDIAAPGGALPATAFPSGGPGMPGSPPFPSSASATTAPSASPKPTRSPEPHVPVGTPRQRMWRRRDPGCSIRSTATARSPSARWCPEPIWGLRTYGTHSRVAGSSARKSSSSVPSDCDWESSRHPRTVLLARRPCGLNKEFTINFGGPLISTSSQWLWGGTIGGGLAWFPPGLQLGNRQIKLFAQYQHIFVKDGEVQNPTVSPLFAYTFTNDMDIVTVGISIPFGPSTR